MENVIAILTSITALIVAISTLIKNMIEAKKNLIPYKKYDYRIQFTKINKVERENIVRFVFERERWMRKKSIGKI